jgi:nucleolar complex protein 2
LGDRKKIFIPISTVLLGIIASGSVSLKKGSTKGVELSLITKVSKQLVQSQLYREGVSLEALDVLLSYCASLSKFGSFPELAIPIVVELKRTAKKFPKNSKIRSKVKQTVSKILEECKDGIQYRRSKLNPNLKEQVKLHF